MEPEQAKTSVQAAAQTLLKIIVLAQGLWSPKSPDCPVVDQLALFARNLNDNLRVLEGTKHVGNTATCALEFLEFDLRLVAKHAHDILGKGFFEGFFESVWEEDQVLRELLVLRERIMIPFELAVLLAVLDVALESEEEYDEYQQAFLRLHNLLRNFTSFMYSADLKDALVEEMLALWVPLFRHIQSQPDQMLEEAISLFSATEAQTDENQRLFTAALDQLGKVKADREAAAKRAASAASSASPSPSPSNLGALKWYHDPITRKVMCDPVKANDRRTYDRWTIIDESSSNAADRPETWPLKVEFDDIDVRSRLFDKFPEQQAKYTARRTEYRQQALDKANQGLDDEALVMLKHVLAWAEDDDECKAKREEILHRLSGGHPADHTSPSDPDLVARIRDLIINLDASEIPSPAQDPLPHLNAASRGSSTTSSITISSDLLSATFVTQPGTRKVDAVAVQADRPLPIDPDKSFSYYEMEIKDKGTTGCMAIGFSTPASFRPDHLPGHYPDSWGYQGDDGSFHFEEPAWANVGYAFQSNDVVGAGILLSCRRAFFTHNGHLIGAVDIDIPAPSESETPTTLLPTIALQSRHSKVRLNFGQSPFEPEPLPTRLDEGGIDPAIVTIFNASLEAWYVRDPGPGAEPVQEVVAFAAEHPAPCRRLWFYFEVEIVDSGPGGEISVGFSGKGQFERDRHAGWNFNTLGYHGDNGHLYSGSGSGREFGPTFVTGDVVGAGIHYGVNKIFFVKNGELVGSVPNDLKGGLLYPTVGLTTFRHHVRLNFSQEQFQARAVHRLLCP